jgi:hypothetical protein
MPRMAKQFLDCVVYIYPDKAAADADEAFGGSGFVVARHVKGGYQTFIVTNRHVIDKIPNPIIRLNRMAGGTETFATNIARWINHPDGDDLSAYQLDMSAEDHNQAWIWQHAFLTPKTMVDYLGLGSDVAMLGRFIGLNGMVNNSPTARFGAIAALDTIQEINSFGNPQETFVIDCHSVSGYSGSPVIAYLPSTAVSETALENSGLGPWLLGVNWKHFGSPEKVVKKDDGQSKKPPFIKGNSGLMGAVPAWRIPKLLDQFPQSLTGNSLLSGR